MGGISTGIQLTCCALLGVAAQLDSKSATANHIDRPLEGQSICRRLLAPADWRSGNVLDGAVDGVGFSGIVSVRI